MNVEHARPIRPGEFLATNPTDLPRFERAELLKGGSGICLEASDTPREYWRRGAEFLDDPGGTGLFSPGIDPCRYLSLPAFLAAIDDAVLTGFRTILTPDDRFFTDEAYAQLELLQRQLDRVAGPDPSANERSGLAPTGRERIFRFEPGHCPVRQIEGPVLVLSSDEPESYGSFLFCVLPKVRAARRLGLTGLPCIAFANSGSVWELLLMAAIPAGNLIEHDYNTLFHFDRAYILCLRNPHGNLDAESLALYAELRVQFGSRRRNQRIYVSRWSLNRSGSGAPRVMLNEPQLIERLASIGFDIVEPETLTACDQILAFTAASLVAGPSGSGLYSTMFCHPSRRSMASQKSPTPLRISIRPKKTISSNSPGSMPPLSGIRPPPGRTIFGKTRVPDGSRHP